MAWRNGETVEVLRDSPRDRYGDGGGYDFHHYLHNVIIKWGPSEDLNASGRDSEGTVATLFCPQGSDALASDRMRLPDGYEYWVVGKPKRPQGAYSGRRPYVEVRLKAVT